MRMYVVGFLVRYIVRGGWVRIGIGNEIGIGMVLHVYIAGTFEEAGLDSKSVAGISSLLVLGVWTRV
jgi:hypothetical protein